MSYDQRRCRCGHPQYWHAYPPGVAEPLPDDAYGACEITGPQITDGCACTAYSPADQGAVQ